MINIVIDTNIFLKNMNLDNAAFSAIKNLGKNHLLKIHLPFIVEKEYITNKTDSISKEYDSMISSIKRLKKKNLNNEILNNLESILNEVNGLKKDSISFASKNFDEWMLDAKATKHKIKLKHSNKVWDSYFKGHPPFPLKKSRKDIPDAFIYEIIKDLCEKENHVYFVCEDGNLKNAANGISKLVVFSSLENFIESQECQMLLKEQRLYDLFDELIIELGNNVENIKGSLNNELQNYLSGEIITDDSIRDDNNEATIDSISEIFGVIINVEETTYYGDKIIVIPFQANILANTYYFMYKSDYYSLTEEESKNIFITDANYAKHYFMVDELFNLSVEGNIAISLDIKALNKGTKISKIIDYGSIEIDSLDSIKLFNSI